MFRTLFLFSVLFFNLNLSASRDFIDLELDKKSPKKTKNGRGVSFNNLGPMENLILGHCKSISENEKSEIDLKKQKPIQFLVCGGAFGVLSAKIINSIKKNNYRLIFNEISEDNAKLFIEKTKHLSKNLIVPVICNCLKLKQNKIYKSLFPKENLNNSLDKIICLNVLHFFKPKQVLNFFIDMFNFLKPGGRAYLLVQQKSPALSKKDAQKIIKLKKMETCSIL